MSLRGSVSVASSPPSGWFRNDNSPPWARDVARNAQAGAGVGASLDALNYGMALAAMSQYAKTLNLPSSSALVMAMMSDAADGVLDGKSGTSPISMQMGGMMRISSLAASAGTSSLASAMSSFMGSVQNASGLTAANVTTLMQKLVNSNGQI